MDRALQYAFIMRFDKPIGFYLLMWPTLWALWIAAEGQPRTDITIIFLVGIVLMRAAGCIINDYADRKIDQKVARTKDRPLATGAVGPREAIVLFAIVCLIAFILVLYTNLLTFMLSFIAVILAVVYPFTKRYTYMPQAFLGLAFGWAVPMAFAAQTESVPTIAWLLLTATVLWATAYDTFYAMVDREDDIEVGVKSTAILFGDADRIIIAAIQITFILTMFIIGRKLEMGIFYYLGLSAAIGFAAYQHYLAKDRDPEKCLKAFLNNNLFGAAIFFGIVFNYMAV